MVTRRVYTKNESASPAKKKGSPMRMKKRPTSARALPVSAVMEEHREALDLLFNTYKLL